MTYLNARAKNIGNDQGDVYKYFQNELSNLVQHNGGDHLQVLLVLVELKLKTKLVLKIYFIFYLYINGNK